MTAVKFKVFDWDWKDKPDWAEINEFIKELNCRPYLYDIYSNDDDYKVMVADTPLLPEEVELLYED